MAAAKLRVVQVRATYKDYFDIFTLLESGGLDLATGLAAARAVYGASFNPMVSLKALTYFGDGDLSRLTTTMQESLIRAVRGVDTQRLPTLSGKLGLTASKA